MASFLNHCAISAPRNGTTTHTVDPSTGTVASGALFTPTAGNLLVCVVEGAVTTFGSAAGTAPTGWTLPTGAFVVGSTGLYVFTKTATGADTLVANHNGSNYPLDFDFYEYAAGSTFSGATASSGVSSNGGANPVLTGLTGTNHIFYVFGLDVSSGGSTTGVTWSSGTKLFDSGVAFSTTDGYVYSTAVAADSTATSSPANTATQGSGLTTERITYAVKIAASAATATPFRRPQIVRQAVNRAGSF